MKRLALRLALLVTLFFLVVPALPAIAAAGDLDTTFSTDGTVVTGFEGIETNQGFDVAVQGDGRIVVVGSAYLGTRFAFALVRYNSDGSLDDTFSGDGRVLTKLGGDSRGRGVAIQSDGKIVVVGIATKHHVERFGVARYNPNGSLDPSFSGDGKRMTAVSTRDSEALDVAIQSDHAIVVVGSAGGFNPGRFALARYRPSGSLDHTFGGGDGIVQTRIGSESYAHGVALQQTGEIVAAGTSLNRRGSGGRFAAARYDPDGSLDTTFGGDGKIRTAFPDFVDAGGNAVSPQSDGKIVIGGDLFGRNGERFGLARYQPGGALDVSFGGDGRVVTGFGSDAEGSLLDLAIQPDDRIVATGERLPATSGAQFAVARYNPADGSLDQTFGGDGRVTTQIGRSAIGNGVALQPDGKIVVAGDAIVHGHLRFAAARYLAA